VEARIFLQGQSRYLGALDWRQCVALLYGALSAVPRWLRHLEHARQHLVLAWPVKFTLSGSAAKAVSRWCGCHGGESPRATLCPATPRRIMEAPVEAEALGRVGLRNFTAV
jgi:hypothetical protein